MDDITADLALQQIERLVLSPDETVFTFLVTIMVVLLHLIACRDARCWSSGRTMLDEVNAA